MLLIAAILLLTLLNSLFVCMEMALVSVPRARLKKYKQEHRPGASVAIRLQKDIDSFFAVVQIGITFVMTLSSALGGAGAVELFTPVLNKLGIPIDSMTAQILSILAITVTIAYVNLVIGELVPKSLARRQPGRVSLLFAPLFGVISKWLKPVVVLLTASTRLFLRLIGVKAVTTIPTLTPEELRLAASELVETKQMPTGVYDILVQVTRLTQIRVEDVMIPRHRIVAIRAESKQDPRLREKILQAYRKHHFTCFPIIDKKGENVLGVINIKDLLLYDDPRKTPQVIRQANFTARGQSLDKVLSQMQKIDEQLTVVVDEHGIIDGVITLEDILEELIGELGETLASYAPAAPQPEPSKAILVDGLITLHELKEEYSISLPQSLYYSTLAGFVLDKLGKIPIPGDFVENDQFRFEVMQMERNRIKEIRIIPLETINSGTANQNQKA
jgi:putative hemolysin